MPSIYHVLINLDCLCSQIDDCTQDWTWEENSVDYVHIRWLFGSIKDWTALFKQAYKCLKPGGYLESQEPSVSFSSDDGSVHEKTAMGQFGKFFIEGGKMMGRSTTVLEDEVQVKSMQEAGFEEIKELNLKVS
jgi:ubiquinone/menaquinone biosynthesis C-methylase UbiE